VRELTESEARYRTLADLSPDAILVNVAQRIVYANAAAARMLAAPSPAALIGHSTLDFLPPEYHARFAAAYERLLQGEDVLGPRTRRWMRADGTVLDVEVTSTGVEWSGEPALQVLARDVTERRRMEEQLRRSEERYRLATAALSGYVYDWEFGSDTVHFSPGMSAMLGYEGETLPLEWWRSLVHPDDVTGLLARSRAALAAGRTLISSEYRVRHAGGHWVWIADHATAAYENGACTRIVGSVQNITERKEIEAALAASESLHRAIAANLPAGAVFVIGLDMRYRLAAGEALAIIGRPPEWMVGRLVQDAVPDHLREQYLAQYRAAFAGETVSSERVIHGHTFLSRAGPLRNERGQILGALAVSVDITERKRAEESLREADRRKDEFLATLAHELRNPLAPIRTAAHVLRSPGLTDAQREQAREMIERQSRHLTRLVDDLMEISRLTLGRIELELATVSLASVIEQAIEAAAAIIESQGHVLQIERPAAPLILHADGVRLAQVLTNLLTNAAKYTPRGGRITVAARAEGADVVLSVRDTGVGIPPSMLERVFDMFTQVPRADGLTASGLGIGLALVRRLVEMHGGRIDAYSEGEGRGSEFVVRLPRAAPPSGPDNGDTWRAVAHVPRRVLVVDDNEDAGESLGMALRLMGHDVQVVSGGGAALAALEAAPYDIVFLDIGMPGIDGYEVARRVRARLGAQSPRLVALTGWGQEADRERAIGAGFDHHLTKPADPEQVAALIARLGAVASRPA